MELRQLEKFANAQMVLDEAIEAHRPDLEQFDQTLDARFKDIWASGLGLIEGPDMEGPIYNGGEVEVTGQTESGIQLIGQLALTINRAPRGSLGFTSKIVAADWFHSRDGSRQRISVHQKISDANIETITERTMPEQSSVLEHLTMLEQSIASMQQLIYGGSDVQVERRAFELAKA